MQKGIISMITWAEMPTEKSNLSLEKNFKSRGSSHLFYSKKVLWPEPLSWKERAKQMKHFLRIFWTEPCSKFSNLNAEVFICVGTQPWLQESILKLHIVKSTFHNTWIITIIGPDIQNGQAFQLQLKSIVTVVLSVHLKKEKLSL